MNEQHPQYPQVTLTDYWPLNGPVDTSDIRDSGAWSLWMDRGGVMSLWGPGDPAPQGSLPVYRHDDVEELRKVFVRFCRRGYNTDPTLTNQDGIEWIFNWRSFTLAQLGVAKRVAHLSVTGKVDEAWTVGHAFQDQIDAAVREAVSAARAS